MEIIGHGSASSDILPDADLPVQLGSEGSSGRGGDQRPVASPSGDESQAEQNAFLFARYWRVSFTGEDPLDILIEDSKSDRPTHVLRSVLGVLLKETLILDEGKVFAAEEGERALLAGKAPDDVLPIESLGLHIAREEAGAISFLPVPNRFGAFQQGSHIEGIDWGLIRTHWNNECSRPEGIRPQQEALHRNWIVAAEAKWGPQPL